ncbi:helix-turn-helix domain-containing protein [Paenibacillus wynnii]|uniref:Schlafen AlbA-2 domain-containing protein n=1 Tax=Paenibacillus wynnii TaxID=268407 RepID=A0A098M4V2_9BACL|nr:ATP-binding protein [Paenibacillus wynnii]KGE17584.1 hypothetical protein PWYN_23625 [Paenibacillus wynnii]
MVNAFSIYQRIIDGRYSGIKSMIGSREENLFLDFKQKSAAQVRGAQKDDRKIYAKALSGFSNSAGGVIVWGISTEKENKEAADIASEEKPIKYIKNFLTDLNNLINEAIVPLNIGIINQVIYINDDQECDEGFVITYVPESELPPHRAMLGDNLYYTRAGDSFIKMEHHMLEDSFGRRQKPKLEIFYNLNQHEGNRFSIVVGIKNTGKYIATYPSIRIIPTEDIKDEPIQINLNVVTQYFENDESKGVFFAGGINDVIHPNTYIEVTILHPKDNWLDKKTLFSYMHKNRNLEFNYEMYAEGCTSVMGTVKIEPSKILESLSL